MITGKSYIGYTRASDTDTPFRTFNPILNMETPWTFYEASKKEVDQAVSLAWKAFKEYSALPGAKKATFLRTIAVEIEGLGTALLETYCQETGLPEGRAQGERGRTCFQLRTFADLVEEGSWVNAKIDTAQEDRTPLPKPDLRKMSVPIGPIAVFGASNFPLAYSTAGGDTASALASGCPVIVKSHPMHAGTGELVASAIIKAAQKTGIPEGVFSNLNSRGIEVGQQLTKHPKIKGIGFTGSISGGRALFDLAAQRPEPIPVFAEMGSINPVVLLPEALESKGEAWAQTYASSITLGTGQFCTNPGLIVGIQGAALESFSESLASSLLAITPTSMLHPQISKNYQKNKKVVSGEPDVTVLGDYKNEVAANVAQQSVVTVSGATFLQNKQLHQEVFGPFSMVVACKDVLELNEVIAHLEGQLTGTIIASEKELNMHQETVHALANRVGRIIFNGVPTGVEVCPAMQHGGPYPASTDSRFGAVGIDAIQRWVRPLSFQNWPNQLLPAALQNENPLGITRLVNNTATAETI